MNLRRTHLLVGGLGLVNFACAIGVAIVLRFALGMGAMGVEERYRFLDQRGAIDRGTVGTLLGEDHVSNWRATTGFLFEPLIHGVSRSYWIIACVFGANGLSLTVLAFVDARRWGTRKRPGPGELE